MLNMPGKCVFKCSTDARAVKGGDVVAIVLSESGSNNIRWTLGEVVEAPYMQDVEVRLWERQYEALEVAGQRHILPEGEGSESGEGRSASDDVMKSKEVMRECMRRAAALTESLKGTRAEVMATKAAAEAHLAHSRAAVCAARRDVESISYSHWNELKSYRVPPKMVTTILRAVMLLLKEDTAKTWQQMQSVMRSPHFRTRILEFCADKELSMERCNFILRECVSRRSFRYDRATEGSMAMGPIYYWTLAQLDTCHAVEEKCTVKDFMNEQKKVLSELLNNIQEQQQHMGACQAELDRINSSLSACGSAKVEEGEGQGTSVCETGQGTVEGTGDVVRSVSPPYVRYMNSFAGQEGKEYLLPAFYTWVPTDYSVIILRSNILTVFNSKESAGKEEAYALEEIDIRFLDAAIVKRYAGGDFNADDLKEIEAAHNFFAPASPSESDTSASSIIDVREYHGNHWFEILLFEKQAIEDTFRTETATALGFDRACVEVTSSTYEEGRECLMMEWKILHSRPDEENHVKRTIRTYPYPLMEALYNEKKANISFHHLVLKGNEWPLIVSQHEEELRNAIISDTMRIHRLSEAKNVQVISIKATDELQADYVVSSSRKLRKHLTHTTNGDEHKATKQVYKKYATLRKKKRY
uniref:WGS project CAEQ00000000 data, annotated contig 1544 n=1 Tax=Trypanosoma congolense (strain IL3000) TaxID=1068625 RepID=F9W702_TRYCI|nr:unnamed protein product [Trypanosoma congolense IL3000]